MHVDVYLSTNARWKKRLKTHFHGSSTGFFLWNQKSNSIWIGFLFSLVLHSNSSGSIRFIFNTDKENTQSHRNIEHISILSQTLKQHNSLHKWWRRKKQRTAYVDTDFELSIRLIIYRSFSIGWKKKIKFKIKQIIEIQFFKEMSTIFVLDSKMMAFIFRYIFRVQNEMVKGFNLSMKVVYLLQT